MGAPSAAPLGQEALPAAVLKEAPTRLLLDIDHDKPARGAIAVRDVVIIPFAAHKRSMAKPCSQAGHMFGNGGSFAYNNLRFSHEAGWTVSEDERGEAGRQFGPTRESRFSTNLSPCSSGDRALPS